MCRCGTYLMWSSIQGHSGQPDAFTGILLFQSELKYRKSRSINVKKTRCHAHHALRVPVGAWLMLFGELQVIKEDFHALTMTP